MTDRNGDDEAGEDDKDGGDVEEQGTNEAEIIFTDAAGERVNVDTDHDR